MKYFFIILSEFMILVDSGVNNFINLPLGDYRINVIATQPCKVKLNSCSIQYNFFLFKTSKNTTDIRGNITINRAFDDSLLFHCSMAVKDKIGSWQSNAYVYNSPQAYSSFKKLFGAEFSVFLNSFGMIETAKNSILPGVYTTKGYDVSNYPKNTNIPKQLFYGTYKFKFILTEKNGDQVGCSTFTLEIKRPWETE